MPDHSASECVYVLDGQIGQSYLGALDGWEFFENSELMFKDGICEDEHQIDISAFFKFVKKGVNPLVDFKTFEARKAALDEENEEQEPGYSSDLPENSETVAEILNLENPSSRITSSKPRVCARKIPAARSSLTITFAPRKNSAYSIASSPLCRTSQSIRPPSATSSKPLLLRPYPRRMMHVLSSPLNSLKSARTSGVLPLPPRVKFPTLIIGILNFCGLAKSLFRQTISV